MTCLFSRGLSAVIFLHDPVVRTMVKAIDEAPVGRIGAVVVSTAGVLLFVVIPGRWYGPTGRVGDIGGPPGGPGGGMLGIIPVVYPPVTVPLFVV